MPIDTGTAVGQVGNSHQKEDVKEDKDVKEQDEGDDEDDEEDEEDKVTTAPMRLSSQILMRR